MFATCHWLFTTCQFFQDHQFNFLLFTLHLFVPTNFQRLCEGALPLRSWQTIGGSKAFEFWCLSTLGGDSHHPIPLLSHPEWFGVFQGPSHLVCLGKNSLRTFFALLVSQDGFRYEALQGGMGRIVPTAVWLPEILVSMTTTSSRTWRAEMPACLSCTKRSDVWEKQMNCGAKSTSAFHKPSWRCEGEVERWGPARWKDHGQWRVSMLHLKILTLLAKPS